MKRSKGEKIFDIFNYIILAIIGICALYPFWYSVMASISSGTAVVSGKVWFLPVEINIDAYKRAFRNPDIWTSYGNSIYITVVGTLVNIVFTVFAAYALSKKRLRGRSFLSFAFVLPMWLNPGIIPMFLNIRSLGLYNTRFSVIIAFAVTPIYVIILRTFFQSIPDSMEESAKIDGASDFLILKNIFIPLAKPSIITISLYYAVHRWNGYFWTMILIKDKDKFPLQVLLKEIVVEMKMNAEFMVGMDNYKYSTETVLYSFIVIAIIPMVLVYPFLQRYFVKGIMIGAIKG